MLRTLLTVAAAAIVLVLGFFVFRVSGQTAGLPIRVGSLHSSTGTMAASERPLIDAVPLAIEELHAQSTIITADRISVMAGGCLVQAGTVEELVNQHGMFADLVRRQIA